MGKDSLEISQENFFTLDSTGTSLHLKLHRNISSLEIPHEHFFGFFDSRKNI